MIADTTLVSDLISERQRGRLGGAARALAGQRAQTIRLTIITAGEIAVTFNSNAAAWEWLDDWKIYRLHPGVVDAAADIDRQLTAAGGRLGENDNWIAGFCRAYSEPLLSRDEAFDRVPGLRRVAY